MRSKGASFCKGFLQPVVPKKKKSFPLCSYFPPTPLKCHMPERMQQLFCCAEQERKDRRKGTFEMYRDHLFRAHLRAFSKQLSLHMAEPKT